MATEHTGLDAEELVLERELASLLDVKTFEPSAGFREHALLSDPAIYAEAEADWQGWWARQASELHWSKPWDKCSTTPIRRSTSGSSAAS